MLVGRKIGPFAIEKELGSGAMGTVYRARHLESGQRVAIKVMAPGLGTSDLALARFKREAAILKQLAHPNIVRLLAIGRFHKTPFYAMEYIEGESLDHVLARRNRLTWEEVIELGQHLCAALQCAHQQGVIHRDLKPSNLMVLADGTVKLTDFGIAKDLDMSQLTASNATVGTASYMSPEQCRGERDLTSKSDLYSLGVMFYELLTGRKPFQAESAMEMFVLHNSGTFERPSRLVLDIPIWLDTLVCQLLEKKPEQRPLDAEGVSQALGRIKEKVLAQQSAGVEAAKSRRADRTGLQPRLDETDKEAARTLLGKKKRQKVMAFYRRAWFQVVVLSALLANMAFIFYLAFLKPPAADSLLVEAEKLVQSSAEDRLAARKGPIKDFLAYYPDHEKAPQVRLWADQIDCEVLERQMHNRRNSGFKIDGEAEKLARRALDEEDAGKLAEAAKNWQELLGYKERTADDPDRPWGLVAEKYLQELQAVAGLYQEIQNQAGAEKKNKKDLENESKGNRKKSRELELALQAVRAEAAGKSRQTLILFWQDLKKTAEQERQLRPWFLLAVKRVRELEMDAKEK